WTDVLQFAMIFVGLAAGIWAAATAVPGGLGELWAVAGEAGKLQVIDPTWDPASIRSLPTALFAYGILAFGVAGTNQQSVQRYVSCADLPSGRKAILLGWFSGFVGVAATLILGVLLFGFYSLNPDLLTGLEVNPDGTLAAADGILPYFIANQVPVGAAGLLVAAIFAAAMSSIDSALHSLATCMTVDFYQRYSKTDRSDAQSLKVAQGLIVVWGILGIFAAFYVASTGEDLLPFLVTYATLLLGPLLGLFLMGVLFPRVNANGAFYGTLAAAIILIVGTEANLITFLPSGIWRAAFIAPIAVVLGLLISLVGGVPAERSVRGLTIWTQE
ncbi:MAG: sodium-coupled permease, partial [Cyanobacteria bacterium P01_F01_bin.53]